MYSYDEYYYGYNAMENTFAGIGGFIVAFVLVFYLLMLGLSIATYILQSVGLYSIAKRRGIHHPWLAWIPFGSAWIVGSISDQYQYVAKGRVKNRRKILLGLLIAIYATLFLFFVIAIAFGYTTFTGDMTTLGFLGALFLLVYIAAFIMAIVACVFNYIALYDVYASCEPHNAATYLILSIFISITMPFFIFALRKKDGGMPPRKAPEPELPELEVVETPTAEETEE